MQAMATADWGGQPGSRLGLDIGGTLAKLVYFESKTRPSWCNGRIAQVLQSLGASAEEARESLEAGAHELHDCSAPSQRVLSRQMSFWGEHDRDLSFYDNDLAGRLHFLTFRSDHMERFVDLLEREELHHGMSEICCSGGGAYKYAALFRDRLGVELRPVDELAVVVQGIAWLVERPVQEMIWLESHCAVSEEPDVKCPVRQCKEWGSAALWPFLLVNIGSGVSIVKVNGLDSFERVSGSAIGGGTFWGLCSLLCPDCKDFGEAGRLAQDGDASIVNLLVEDIYGGDYTMSNGAVLPGSLTASFFAKAAADKHSNPNSAAIVHALTKMISSNICQIAYLNAKMHGVNKIVFTGNFLRQNPVAREAISENMKRVSRAHSGEPFRALFLQHEGYFGALGSFLHNVQESHVVPLCRRTRNLDQILREPKPSNSPPEEANPNEAASPQRRHVVEVVRGSMRSLSNRAWSRAAYWVSRRPSGGASNAAESCKADEQGSDSTGSPPASGNLSNVASSEDLTSSSSRHPSSASVVSL